MNMLIKTAALMLLTAGCEGENRVGTGPTEEHDQSAAVPTQEYQAQTGQAGMPRQGESADRAATPAAAVNLAGVASCRPGAQVSIAASRLMSFADANGDGKVMRDEARAAVNFVVGGFFFRADENGDGTVTPEEGLQARKELANQQPALAVLFQTAREATGGSPFAQVAQMVDVEYGKPLKAEEARTAARSAVDGLYAAADENKDQTITVEEARAASWQGAQALGSVTFNAADADDSGHLTIQEFQNAWTTPAKLAFELADANGNGQLTQEEATIAVSSVVQQLGMPAGKI